MQYNPQSNYGYTNSPAASQTYSASASQSYANASVDSLTTSTTGGINYLLKNNYVRVFIFVLAVVYAGYTVMPLPSKLKKMLHNSYLMKYLILFFVAASMLHPLDNDKLKICVIVPIFVLLMFRVIKNHSSGKSLFHGIASRGEDCSDSESRHSSRGSRRGSRYSEDSESRHPGAGAGAGMLATGAVGVGLGYGMRDRKEKKGKKSKKDKKKRSKKHKKGKKGKKDKKSSSSDSVKGMAKAEHFSFI